MLNIDYIYAGLCEGSYLGSISNLVLDDKKLLFRYSGFVDPNATKTSRWRGTLVRWNGQRPTDVYMERTWLRWKRYFTCNLSFKLYCSHIFIYQPLVLIALPLWRIRPLSSRGSETGLKDMTGTLLRTHWRQLGRLIKSESTGKLDTTPKGLFLWLLFLHFSISFPFGPLIC